MKKKTPILLFSLALGLLPLSVSGLTSCETKKAVYSINLNQVVTEIASALIGSIAIVICVPITAIVASQMIKCAKTKGEDIDLSL